MYRFIRFAQESLEHFNQVDSIGSGSTPTAYQQLAEGGALDLFGDQDKHPGAVERTLSRRLAVPPGTTAETDLSNLFFRFLKLRGKRSRLYRELVNGDIHWQYARLVEVTAERSYEQTKFRRIQDISLRFVTQDALWRGDLGGTWYLDSGEYLDSGLALDSERTYPLTTSPESFSIEIGDIADDGRGPTRAVHMEISAGALSMSNITISRADGESINWSGTILANKVLMIDTGTMQVLNDGVDAYDDLVLSPTADLAVWFALEPGENDITVTFTGGGVGKQISFSYYEVWY
jgi:hypothetical protein